jgi:predicted transposase YbfD/YdcC
MRRKQRSLVEHFQLLPDPRQLHHRSRKHELIEIVVIAVLAVICGADSWYDIELFGTEKRSWLKQFLRLQNGIPSHDTFGRVFSILDPASFATCFEAWVKDTRISLKDTVVAIDGKSVRRSHGKGVRPLHLINAFATESGLVLGQRKVDGKSNEITAIPELLKMLSLKGCIVTIDAMGTQGWIVKKIKEQSADYVLAAKGNQGRLHRDIKKVFERFRTGMTRAQTMGKSHGRSEVRECWATTDLSSVRDVLRWDGLRSIAAITDTRTIDGKTTATTRYFISSLSADASRILSAVRAHWKIENSLHWSLDMAFKEDYARSRIGHAQENLALVRKLALNILKRDTGKGSLIGKRKRAGWNEEYLLKVAGIVV